MQPKLKKILTLFILYEVIMIMVLSYEEMCNGILCAFSHYSSCDFCEYDGFQYLIMCIFIPALFFVIFMWRKEIATFFRKLWYVIRH